MSKRPPPTTAPTSDEDSIDERKRKRKQSNRESARRSRMRKQQQLSELTAQVAELKGENERMAVQVEVGERRLAEMEAEGSLKRMEAFGLMERLQSLNMVLRVVGEAEEAPEPWRVRCLSRPMVAPANMFQC